MISGTGCSWMKDQRRPMRSFQSGALNLSCLQEATGNLQALFAGKLGDSPEEQGKARMIWDCLDRTLEVFSTYTKGRNSGYFLTTELQDFANLHLKKGQGISDEFALSIFQLKTAVLGGDEAKLTQGEILKLRANLRAFGEAITPLAPHIHVLLTTWDQPAARNLEALRGLKVFAEKLAAIFASSVHPMKWETLAGFARNLDAFLATDRNSALAFAYEQKDIMRHVKVLLIGGSDTEIEQERWKPIALGITQAFTSLIVSKDSNERIEKFEFEITSTPAEQGKALDGIGEALKELLKKPDLQASTRIRQIADYWIKARLALEILLPGYGSKVSLGLLLKDPELRQSENRIIGRWIGARDFKADPKSIAGVIAQLREHLAVTDRVLGRELGDQASFSIKRLLTLSDEYREFFAAPEMPAGIANGLGIFLVLRSWITGRSSDDVALSELDPILKKAEQVLLGIPAESIGFEQKLRKVVEVLRQPPEVGKLKRSTIDELLPRLSTLPGGWDKNSLPVESLQTAIDAVFDLKSSLWNSPRDAIDLSDIDTVLDVLAKQGDFKKDPAEAVDHLDRKWKRPGFIPGINLPVILKLSQVSLPQEEPWTKLKGLGNAVGGLRSLRKFLLGKDGDFLPLSDIVEMLRRVNRIRALAADDKGSKGKNRLKAVLDEVLKLKGTLALSREELEELISAAGWLTGRDLSGVKEFVPEFLRLKNQTLGTGDQGIERRDFELIAGLAGIRGKGLDALGGVMRMLEKLRVPGTATLDLGAWASMIEKFSERNPGLLKDKELIAKLKALREIQSIVLGDVPPGISISDIRTVLGNATGGKPFTPVSEVRFLLGLFLSRNKAQSFTLQELRGKVHALKEPVQILTGKNFDADKYAKIVEDVLKAKAVLFGTDEGSISRAELEHVDRALGIIGSDLPKAKKGAKLAALIKATVVKPVRITRLVPALQDLVKDLDLGRKLPLPLTVSNVQKMKYLAMGGDPNVMTPSELAGLASRVVSAESPKDMIDKPVFGLNSGTFLWLESALGLLVESKKEIGLKEALAGIQKYFDDSGMKMRYPMDQSLYDIWNHLLVGNKGAVRTGNVVLTDDMKITTEHVAVLRDLFASIRAKLQDLEKAFGASSGVKNRSGFFDKLKDPSNRRLVDLFPPLTIDNGGTRPSLRLSAAHAAKGDFVFGELAYRIVVSEVVSHLFSRYNVRGAEPALYASELAILLNDLRIPMMNFGLLYKSGEPAKVAKSQMKTINVFTARGNGDSKLEVDETVEFMTLTYGSGATFKALVAHLERTCKAKQVDGLEAFEGRCVMRQVFQPALYEKLYAGSLPGMVAAYKGMSEKQRVVFETGTLKLTGKKLLDEKSRGLFDLFSDRTIDDYSYVDFDLDMLQGINCVHPLIEHFFEEMDANHDEKIQLKEALELFPKLCPTIKEAAKGKVSGDCSSEAKYKDLRALFGYLLVNKEKPGFDWVLWGDKWEDYLSGEKKFTPLSRMDLFTILSNLSP